MSARSWPANTLGFPAAALLTNLLKISPHAEGRQLIHQAHKNNNLRPPPQRKSSQQERQGRKRKEGTEGNHSTQRRRRPSRLDTATWNTQPPPGGMLQLLGGFAPGQGRALPWSHPLSYKVHSRADHFLGFCPERTV